MIGPFFIRHLCSARAEQAVFFWCKQIWHGLDMRRLVHKPDRPGYRGDNDEHNYRKNQTENAFEKSFDLTHKDFELRKKGMIAGERPLEKSFWQAP
jgi:hypothetical protein